MSQPRAHRGFILLALFLSGFAGLMHEIVWARLLANLIGNTAQAQAVVLTVFMGGLALGAMLFGRRSDSSRSALITYVRLELLIAVYCLCLPLLVRAAGVGYDALAASAFESPGFKLTLRLVLALTVVLVPAIWMGGTLPVLARFLVRELSQTREQVASLYALNNLGAVLGAGVAGFFMLPEFGIYPSLAVASALNLAAAGMAWSAQREVKTETSPVAPVASVAPVAPVAAATENSFTPSQQRAALIALALSGFAAMGYEVVFTRIIALSFGSSAHSFTVMLMAFITGIGIGSAYLALRRDVARPLWMFGASQIAVVISLAAVTPMMARLPYWIGLLRVDFGGMDSGYGMYQAAKAGLIFLVLAVPTICIGFGFPLAAQIHSRTMAGLGKSVGATYAWNTLGNVAGIVATSLLLIPALGILRSFELLLAFNFVAALCVLGAASEVLASRKLKAAAAGILALALYAFLGRGWSEPINYAVNHLRMRERPGPEASEAERKAHPTASFENWKTAFVSTPNQWTEFFFEEEADTTVLACAREKEALLFVNGKGDASTGVFDMVTQLLLGHLPLFLEPQAKDVLVIGLGSGVTAGSAMLHGVEHLDVVEISSGVLEAEKLFSPFNHQVLKNPKVTTWRDDARTFLRTVPRKYDVIISEPSNPWIAGVGNLFTTEFFESGRERLNPGGVMCIWFHQYEQSNEALQLVLRTVRKVFPEVSLFVSYNGDVIALSSMQPLTADFAKMEAQFDRAEVRQDLARVGLFNLATLLSHHAVSPTRISLLTPPGPLNRDLHQRLEYLAGRAQFVGEDADLISRCDGFAKIETGRTDSLLDSYIEWRKTQGEPVGRDELEAAAAWVKRMLVEESDRLVGFANERVKLGVVRATLPPRASRGGSVPLSEMDFAEASNTARMQVNAGKPEAAIPIYRRALELEPGHLQSTIDLAQVLLGLKRNAEATALVDSMLAANPNAVDKQLAAATFYFRADRVEDVKRICNEVLAIDARNVMALLMLGNLAESGPDPRSAIPYYQQVIAIDPARWEASYRLALMLGKDPNTAVQAMQVLDFAIRANPAQRELRDLLAQFK